MTMRYEDIRKYVNIKQYVNILKYINKYYTKKYENNSKLF